jgi:predicted ATPase with chaperone activity
METKQINFNQVVGQESAKRAIEVALIGNHSLTLIGPPGMGKSLLIRCAYDGYYATFDPKQKVITDLRLYERWPCRCGNYGDLVLNCLCTPHDLFHLNRKARKTDMYISCPRVEYQRLKRGTEGELTEAIMKRVKAGREFLSKVKDDIPPEAHALLKHALDSLGLSAAQYFTILKIAKSIAAGMESETIHTAHVVEAIHYMIRPD